MRAGGARGADGAPGHNHLLAAAGGGDSKHQASEGRQPQRGLKMLDVLLTVLGVVLVALLIRLRRDRLAGRDGRGPQLRSIPFSNGGDGEFLVRNRSRK